MTNEPAGQQGEARCYHPSEKFHLLVGDGDEYEDGSWAEEPKFVRCSECGKTWSLADDDRITDLETENARLRAALVRIERFGGTEAAIARAALRELLEAIEKFDEEKT